MLNFSVMALTPSPLSVIMILIFKKIVWKCPLIYSTFPTIDGLDMVCACMWSISQFTIKISILKTVL